MAGSLNRLTLIGNLGKDPKITVTPSGSYIASFSVATSEKWKDPATGEKVEHTEWHNIVIFSDYLAKLSKNLTKGSKVFVEGTLRTRRYTNAAGTEQISKEVIVTQYQGNLTLLDHRGPQDEQEVPPSSSAGRRGRRDSQNGPLSHDNTRAFGDEDDEIPFI